MSNVPFSKAVREQQGMFEKFWYGESFVQCKKDVREFFNDATEDQINKAEKVFFDRVNGLDGYCRLDGMALKNTLRGFVDPVRFDRDMNVRGSTQNANLLYVYRNRYNPETQTILAEIIVIEKETKECRVFYATRGLIMETGTNENDPSVLDRMING